MSKRNRARFSCVGLWIVAAAFTVACSSDKGGSVDGEAVTLKVTVSGDEIDNVENTFGRAATGAGEQIADSSRKILGDIDFGKDFYISPELSAEKASFDPPSSNLSSNAKAVIIRNPIQRQIVFRMVVYDAAGNYVLNKLYNISAAGAVTPSDGQDMVIPSGNYTIIAYSYNNNTAPNETVQGTTLNSSFTINPATYPQFMMYSSGTVTVSQTQTTNLNIIFKYKFTPLVVVIDATRTNGYLISSIGTTTLGSTRASAQINLGSQQVTFTGGSSNRAITFPASELNKEQATSNVVWVASDQANGLLTVNSLTVGPLSSSGAITQNNVELRPGFGYSLRLRIMPTDRTERFEGQDAVLIAGRYWMKRNLGAPTNVDADNPPNGNFQSLFGNYYQWGRSGVRADSETGARAGTSNLWSTRAGNGAWNSRTLNNPQKTGTDPCPNGWRVPTRLEFQELIDNTTQLQADNKGTNWATSNTRYTSAKVFRSLRDRDVILTFPAAGNYEPSDRYLENRGSAGVYWTSTEAPSGATNAYRMMVTQANNGAAIGLGTNNRNFGVTIRCVQN